MITRIIESRRERSTKASVAVDANDAYLITLTWTTGFKGIRSDSSGRYYEELEVSTQACDLSRLNSHASLLANHDQSQLTSVLGVVERAWIEGSAGKAVVRLSQRPEIAGIVQDIQQGIMRNVSVGYQINEMKDISKPGDKVPTYLATKWLPYEISIVGIPFDPNSQTQRTAEPIPTNEVQIITSNEGSQVSLKNETAVEETEERTIAPTENEERAIADESSEDDDGDGDEEKRDVEPTEERAAEEDAPAVDEKPADEKPSDEKKKPAKKRNMVLVERTRVMDITNAVRAAGLPIDFASDLIDRGIEKSEASALIFKELEKSQIKTSGINRAKEKSMEQNVRSLIVSAMLNRMDARKHELATDALPFKGQTLLRAFESILPREIGEGTASYATRVMTSSDLPALLANIAEKQLRIAYDEQKPTYTVWAKIGTLPDFKQAKLVQTSVFPALLPVGEGGNYQAASMSDAAESVQLSSFGVILSFSRQMLVNDDLSVLASFATRAAAAAQRNVEIQTYSVLSTNGLMADGVALFSTAATRKNLAATATAINVTSLAAGKAAMRMQKDPSGAPLNLAPAFLICGPLKEVEAMQYVNSTFVPNSASTVNPFAGTLQVVVSAQIQDNAWYLAADKSAIDTVGVFMLEGQEAPQVLTRQNFDNGATDIRVTHDVATVAIDFRGLYKNAGA